MMGSFVELRPQGRLTGKKNPVAAAARSCDDGHDNCAESAIWHYAGNLAQCLTVDIVCLGTTVLGCMATGPLAIPCNVVFGTIRSAASTVCGVGAFFHYMGDLNTCDAQRHCCQNPDDCPR